MEKLLQRYLLAKTGWDYIEVNYYDIDGASCYVEFWTDDSRHYKEHKKINVWDMLLFLEILK